MLKILVRSSNVLNENKNCYEIISMNYNVYYHFQKLKGE